MNRLKNAFACFIATTVTALACLWPFSEFNSNYIAGVNNYQEHYTEASSIDSAYYTNGNYVALPLTVYVKIHRGTGSGAQYQIIKAVLQYRIKRSGTWQGPWITVRTIDNISYNIDESKPVPLFGMGNINPRGLVQGDEIYIRYYIANQQIESGDLTDDMDNLVCQNTESGTSFSRTAYTGGWAPAFIYKVIYNGSKQIGW